MTLIAQHFQAVLSLSSQWGIYSVVDVAAAANIHVAVGINMTDPARIQDEITSLCWAYKRNPWAVEAVYVGRENMKNGDFGQYTPSEIAGYITQVKQCVGNTPVGTSQRTEEWRDTDGTRVIVAASDIIGFPLGTFDIQGPQDSLALLNGQYKLMVRLYGAEKLHVTETGYPHCGEPYRGNVPSPQTMKDYFSAVLSDFIPGKGRLYWYSMFDLPTNFPGKDFEKCYGLFNTTGAPNIPLP
ncbi:hypothetical protein PsorP6_015461 [Peronosclerospora sorghi]|uniref:Uncharacterized protein n=1 Tax=Peronosclerospora sorghi TaxID=230839 RepID=A0ACC0WMQ2_9STRA|nr:hypothetical protein PsorP6_015461 [Peronosclerospora sorghi]